MFKVTVKEIKVKELPALDDEFASEVSEFVLWMSTSRISRRSSRREKRRQPLPRMKTA